MADKKETAFSQEQYDLLIKSSKENNRCKLWNEWRKNNPDIKVKLRKAKLMYANLRDVSLMDADLRWAYLSFANLSRANLSRANLSRAEVHGADLIGADLIEADLIGTNLNGANLSWANLRDVRLMDASLIDASLVSAHLTNAHFNDVNLIKANLSGADLSWSYHNTVYFDGANLSGANFSGANLSVIKLCNTNLIEVDLKNARIAYIIFGDIDLSTVKNLNTVKHIGPSTIGIDTIYRSKGKIPEVFLRGAGVPENFIANMHSIVGEGIEYPSCFISYSSKDQEFAEKLHIDLQKKEVRCWFAPEDLKIGDKFRQSIDQAIRILDKLLLVLSENSIDSEWVEKEVETALEEERRRKETVLFPIMLDSSVMETDKAWAADIRRTRHIGDFSEWKEHDKYQESLDRLLRDLKGKGIKELEAEDKSSKL